MVQYFTTINIQQNLSYGQSIQKWCGKPRVCFITMFIKQVSLQNVKHQHHICHTTSTIGSMMLLLCMVSINLGTKILSRQIRIYCFLYAVCIAWDQYREHKMNQQQKIRTKTHKSLFVFGRNDKNTKYFFSCCLSNWYFLIRMK